MEAFGLRPEDYDGEKPPDVIDVWPDNWESVLFFDALGGGSWNMGPQGPVGLRPEAFREVRLAMGIGRDRWPAVFDDVRVMQDAALKEIYK